MKTSFVIPLAILAGGAIVALAVYVSTRPEGSTASNSGNPSLVRPVSSSDHIFGNPAAKVSIVEYADFECDFCKSFDGTLHQVIADEGGSGQVNWVYREFPLTQIHPGALADAEAAECVAATAGNDAFWKFADSLFNNQPVDPKDFGSLALAAGASGQAFSNCYANASSTVAARITADRANGTAVGASGTPYSLILAPDKAPVVVAGAYPYDQLKQLVDQALAQ